MRALVACLTPALALGLFIAACTDDDEAARTDGSPSPSGETPSSTQEFFGPVETAEEAIERVLAEISYSPDSVMDEETATAERMTEEEAWTVVAEQGGGCPLPAHSPGREVWLVRVHGRFVGLPFFPTPTGPVDGTFVRLVPVEGGVQTGSFVHDGAEPGIPDDCDERPTPGA